MTTANQLFELEKDTDTMEDSGTALEWSEEPDSTGKCNQICKVRLRHFISGRLIQVSYYKGVDKMG
jgi:hypothetical protein